MSFYRQQLEDWLKTLNIKATTVLDIGGEQGNVKDRVASWEVEKYKILDLPFYDLQGNKSWDKFNLPHADVIFCLEVFEYLVEPSLALRRISKLLKPGGKAYITFAFVYPTHNEIEADSLRYTEQGIKLLAERAGLKVQNIVYRIDKSGLLQKFYSADGMRAAKQYEHHNATGFIVELVK